MGQDHSEQATGVDSSLTADACRDHEQVGHPMAAIISNSTTANKTVVQVVAEWSSAAAGISSLI